MARGSLAINTTSVSPLRRDGTARRTAADRNGVAQGRRLKETTYPELSGEDGRARLVVLAAEIGGRWWMAQFLRALAKARAQSVPLLLQNRVKAAWLRRWQHPGLQCSQGFRVVPTSTRTLEQELRCQTVCFSKHTQL